jgi:hypothetical protein
MRRAAAVFATLVMALWLLPALAAAAGAPAIEYSTPSPIRNKEATLRFSINPKGLETSYKIEIARVGQDLESHGMSRLTPAGEDPVALEVNIPRYWEGDLIPGTEYHWRVTAWNDEGKTVGAEQLFTTTDGPTPAFTNATATQIGPNRVSFTGTVDPEGTPLTDCRFRWLNKNAYMYGFEKWAATEEVLFGETVPCNESVEEVGSGTEPVPVDGEATGLEPGEYFFRIEGGNAFEALARPIGGVPFTVSADFEVEGPQAPEPDGSSSNPPAPSVGLPAHKSCSRAHSRKAHHRGAKGKKHRHAKRPEHGRACGRRR